VRVSLRPMALGLLFAMTSGCTQPPPPPLRISRDIWIGTEPMSVAEKKGFFREEGAEVDIKLFTEMIDSRRAFEAGNVDAALLTMHEILLMADKGVDGVVVLLIDYSAGGDGIVAHKDLALADLAGKTVGVEIGTVSHYTFLRGLERAGLAETAVTISNIGTNDLPSAFAEGRIQAAASWEPFISTMVRESGGHVVFSSKEIPAEIVDVMIVRPDVYESRKDDLASIAKGWFRAVDFVATHRAEAIEIIRSGRGVASDEIARQLDGVHLAGASDNRDAFGLGDAVGTSIEHIGQFQRFLTSHGLVQGEVDPRSIVSNDVLDRIR
jgi:NitT/TauT family transport system substrate-binding protein